MPSTSPSPDRRFADLARSCAAGKSAFTPFLDPASAEKYRIEAKRAGLGIVFYGGSEDCERVVACISDDEDVRANFPVDALEITWSAHSAAPQHRDIMGALLALGLERDTLGDIHAGEKCAVAYVLRSVSGFICQTLMSCGRAPVSVRVNPDAPLPDPEPPLAVRGTVASVRLDAVLALAFSLSRGDAREVVELARVSVNHTPTLRGDLPLKENDIVSARGLGRFRLSEIGGQSRKERYFLLLAVWKSKRRS